LKQVGKDFGELARNLNALLAGPPREAPITTQAGATASAPAEAGLRGTLAKLDSALDAIAAVLGDRDNQTNIRTSLSRLAEAAAKATEAMEALKGFAAEARKAVSEVAGPATAAARHFDDAARQLVVTAEKTSALMVTINEAATKLQADQGSAGKLLNDPKLYNNLAEAARQMSQLMQELRATVEKWKQEGIPLKLKN